jgi:hypothetical protein
MRPFDVLNSFMDITERLDIGDYDHLDNIYDRDVYLMNELINRLESKCKLNIGRK